MKGNHRIEHTRCSCRLRSGRDLGSVTPPLYQTSTFVSADTEELEAINSGRKRGFVSREFATDCARRRTTARRFRGS